MIYDFMFQKVFACYKASTVYVVLFVHVTVKFTSCVVHWDNLWAPHT